jgi:hypothetical protein
MSTASSPHRRRRPAGFLVAAGAILAGSSFAGATATTEPDDLVEAAVAGLDAFLADFELPDANSDPDELDACPLLSPEEVDGVVAAIGYEGSFDQRSAVLGVDAIERAESTVDYPIVVCIAEVPSEVRSTPGVQAGAVRLPDGVTFADVIASEQEEVDEDDGLLEITGPTPGALGGHVTTFCEPDGGCGAIWESEGLAIFASVDQTALEELGEPDFAAGLEALLEPALRNMVELPVGGPATTV